MIKELFRNKLYWILLFLISGSFAVISFVQNQKRQKLLENAPVLCCREFRSKVNNPSILLINDLRHASAYINYLSKGDKKQDFPFFSIPERSRVKIIDERYNGNLVKIVLIDKIQGRYLYEDFWIWHEFLVACNANFQPVSDKDN